MKYYFLILICITWLGYQPDPKMDSPDEGPMTSTEVASSELLLLPEKGKVYFQNLPFTGTSVEHYAHGQLAVSTSYKNGKREGLYRKWYPTGRLSFESQYVQGKKHGSTKSWWPNGKLRTTSEFVEGVAHGTQWSYYRSGVKFKRLQLVNGREEGLQQAWRENGKLYNNYEAKNGRIFGLKRANLCYELDNEIVQYAEE